MCGEWRSLLEEVGQPKGHVAPTLQLITWTLQLFVAGLSVGSAPVLFIGRGRHGRIRHQPDLTWVCWWRQVTEEEVHLCRAVAAGHYFFFFRRCGGRQHRGEGAGGWHSAVNFRDDARRRDVLLGYAPHALPITCSRRAAVEGREGSGDCDESGLATDPDLRLSSGCCVGPELIEGES